MNEAFFITALCGALFGGESETVHDFTYPGGDASIRIDCENDNRVVEFGLDKRSSLDSIQQALFAGLNGASPARPILRGCRSAFCRPL